MANVCQLLRSTHILFLSFHCVPTLVEVFKNILKAFDNVWHERLSSNRQSMRISDNILNLMDIFLVERYHRVLLNDQSLLWAIIKAGISQGSVSSFRVFLIHIF